MVSRACHILKLEIYMYRNGGHLGLKKIVFKFGFMGLRYYTKRAEILRCGLVQLFQAHFVGYLSPKFEDNFFLTLRDNRDFLHVKKR
jgi:hypothetical protein